MVTQGYSSTIQELLDLKVAAPLREVVAPFIDFQEFPSVEEYNSAPCEHHMLSGAGVPIRFVPEPKSACKHGFKRLYQPRIFLTGEVPSRPRHWHDYFNMLIWRAFPMTKAALNKRHFFAFDEIAEFPWNHPPMFRTPEQDALTVFDEGGMIVAYDAPELWAEMSRKKFVDFGQIPEELKSHFRFFIFGHAVYEELVKNHFNVNASAVGFQVPRACLQGPQTSLINCVDELCARWLEFRTNTLSTKQFVPVPIQELCVTLP